LLAEGNQEKKRDFLKKIGSNFQVADKSLAVEFKNPWNLLADFNSDLSNTHARQRVKSEKSKWRRGGIRTPQNPANNNGNPHNDSQRDSQFPVASSPDLSQVVTKWDKLSAPLKAAILAIVNSAEGQP